MYSSTRGLHLQPAHALPLAKLLGHSRNERQEEGFEGNRITSEHRRARDALEHVIENDVMTNS